MTKDKLKKIVRDHVLQVNAEYYIRNGVSLPHGQVQALTAQTFAIANNVEKVTEDLVRINWQFLADTYGMT